MRWLLAALAALLAGCAIPPKPRYDEAFWRSLANDLPQQERNTP